VGDGPKRETQAGTDRAAEWAVLGEWLASPPPLLHKVELEVLQERLAFMGRARCSLAAAEAELVAEIARRDGDAAAAETLCRVQKRSRSGARKAVKTAAQLEWAPSVAEKLADGAITPEAAGLILDADGEADVDQRALLAAAEAEPEDQFRRTLKDHINQRTSEQELERRRDAQRRRRRASISEQPDGMFHLFAQFDPLTGARVQAALVAKSDQLFRAEDPKDRPTAPQRSADALADLVCTNHNTDSRGGAGAESGAGGAGGSGGGGVAPGFELIVLADYDQVRDAITNARLADGTRLTEAETLAIACDAKILPGIFNKHTGTPLLGRSQRKVSKRHRKRLIARDSGCIGCAAHHQICEVHHLDHWAHGGKTTLENTCLVCWRCHHIRIHLHGEEITRHPGGKLTLGLPTKPADPERPSRPPPNDRHRPHRTPPRTGRADTSHPPSPHARLHTPPAPTADTDSPDPSRPPPHNGHRGSHPASPAGTDSAEESEPPPHNGHRPHPRPATDQAQPSPQPGRSADLYHQLPLPTPIPSRC